MEDETVCCGGPPPRKTARPWCIFDCGLTDTHLVSPRDKASWDSLVKAAEVHKHNAILQIASRTTDDEVPEVWYHRTCRSVFTLKKTIDKLQHSESDDTAETRRQSHRRNSTIVAGGSRVYQPVCIFCQTGSKYTKKSNRRESLVQCAELRSDTAIRNAAVRQNDSRMIAIVSRDLVAAEGHYHRSCYREYTRNRESRAGDPLATSSGDPKVDHYQEMEKRCFDKLFAFVRDSIFEKPHVVRLTDLTQRLVDWLVKEEVDEVKLSTKKHILRKLNAEFGDSLHVVHETNGRVLLYPDNLTMDDLVMENQSLKDELHVLKQNTSNTDGLIAKVSTILRNDIKGLDIQLPWPPLPADLDEPSQYMPNSLTKFLKYLFSGDQDQSAATTRPRVQRLTESVGQDIVHTVTHARVKTPKHIILPFAVKSLTGCVELNRILNRFGHGLSYSQIEEIDTALCLHKLARRNEDGVALPEFIQQFIQASCAWDNIDRLEETLSGGGTSHRVNGIIVQKKMFGPEPQRRFPNQPRDKGRTVKFVEADLPIYNAGTRVGPPPRKYVKLETGQLKEEANKKNLVWILARLHCTSNQKVSSWTGFNILVRDEEEICEDVVAYLPTINAPATNLSTVHEVLIQSQKLKCSLGLQTMVVVFDQALYAKATDIIWKEPGRFTDIVPRMGVFHTVCTLLAVIGKRFQDAGLKDLCIESGVIASGSIAGVLEGRKYNRAIRFHKLMYEALLRLALDGFSSEDNGEDLFSVPMEVIQQFVENISQRSFRETLEDPTVQTIAVHFQECLERL